MATWYAMLKDKMTKTGDNFEIKISTLSDEELKKEFDSGRKFGGPEGAPFTVWGKKYVYFPICYDGIESIGYAPRNPCDISMEHQGGW